MFFEHCVGSCLICCIYVLDIVHGTTLSVMKGDSTSVSKSNTFCSGICPICLH